jgi:hypothetical protein
MKTLKKITRRYQPTKEEIDSLFSIITSLNDAIDINNDCFYDEETSDEQREIIFNSVKAIYKSCLKIYNSNKTLPFC